MLCVYCLSDYMRVKYDKKGNPYFFCEDCQARTFIRNAGKGLATYEACAKVLEQNPKEELAEVASYIRSQDELEKAGQRRPAKDVERTRK